VDEIQEQLSAALHERYEIERMLGEGGMAIVFLARDVKHDRQVAVKVLKPELAASLGHERFLREIQVTARLQHPNILPLYDSGDADGLLYYVMPYVVGESLSDLLAREKQLGLEDAVMITREVAEALAYAHSYGLIHRDIKPDNVMMSNGHAIVADFGIARALSEAGAEKLTQTGMAVGTPAYMSPEQAAGDPGVDARADVYSLGCMLYEMLVGQIPFTGPNAMAIIARHTMDHVTPPSIMRQSIPPELEDVVLRAMEKIPADRFRTAGEVVDALKAIERGEARSSGPRASVRMRGSQAGLRASQMGMRASRALAGVEEAPPRRRWALLAGIGGAAVVLGAGAWLLLGRGGERLAAVTGGLDPRHVAVLYFQDLSPDSSLAAVADGITEGLIERLATSGIQVVSRNGSAQFRDLTVGLDSVGRVLHAGTLVRGSIERAGDKLRVSTSLVDGTSGADLSEARASIQVPAENPLAARDSVVETVSRFLRQRIGREVQVAELRAETKSVEAWSLLQRAQRVRRAAAGLADAAAADAQLASADSLLALAANADPKWPEPVLARGWVAYDRARRQRGSAAVPWLDSAVGAAELVMAADPGDARALELRGTARLRHYELNVIPNKQTSRQLLSDARTDLQNATTKDPELATAWLTLSHLDYLDDNAPTAVIDAKRAYGADAYLEQAANVINQVFWGSIDNEQFTEADTWCGEGATRFPRDPRFTSCQLWLLVTPAQSADIAKAWRLAARLDSIGAPRFVVLQGQFLVGGVIARAGALDSARRVLQRTRESVTVQVDPEQELAAVEALVRNLARQPDVAIDLLKRAVAANPDHDFCSVANRTWWWQDLRTNPRFKTELNCGR
jgi:TolB-like protein/tRNA A-37 threonylcarbamoyl transferase component Bud32